MIEAVIFDWTQVVGREEDNTKEVIDFLKKRGIRIGSTSQCSRKELDDFLSQAASEENEPEYAVCMQEVLEGRPKPYMIWNNLMHLGVSEPANAVKVGTSLEEIREGMQAGLWTVGVISLFSEGIFPSPQDRKEQVRKWYLRAEADYIINDLWELPSVISDINLRSARTQTDRLLTPGPVTTRKRVKLAMLADHCTWDDEYKRLTRSVIDDITGIYADDRYTTVLLQGSGSSAVEAMIQSLCRDQDRILFLVNGEYGKRMVRQAEQAGKTYSVLESAPGRGIDPREADTYLEKNPGIKTVMLVHCETSSGVINPAEQICRLAKARGKQVLIDAVSSFGVYDLPFDAMGADAVASCANVCLEGVPGLSFVVAKKEVLENAKGISRSLCMDLYAQYREFSCGGGKFRFTSPANVLLALRQAMDEYRREGEIKARRQRYEENRAVLEEGMKRLGIACVVEPQYQSCIVMTFALGDLDFTNLYHFLRRRGIAIYPGKLNRLATFRIGTCGNVDKHDMEQLCLAMEDYLERAGELAERN